MAVEIDLSALMASQSCWEIAGYVSVAAVTIGVIGEFAHDFVPAFKRRWPWWSTWGGKVSGLVLIAALAAELVTQVKANSTSGQIIAVISDQAATTRERAAVFENDTAKLRLDLAKLKGPRNIDPALQAKLIAQLQPLPTKTKAFNIGVPVGGLEPGSALDTQLLEIFSRCTWALVPLVNKPSARGQPKPNNGMYVNVGVVGVIRNFSILHHDDFMPVAKILTVELNEAGIAAKILELPADDDNDPNALHISIGAKT